jgi:tetratricopeptide (TPR) repeat protein
MFAYSLNDLGGVLRDAGRPEEAIPLHEQALVIYREKYGEEHPFVGYTLRELGDAYWASRQHPKALNAYTRALQIYQRAYGSDHPETQVVLDRLSTSRPWEG